MSALTQPNTNGHDRQLNGVRTYRGRKLEDLIPQIREELGPDAVILRQREGLMGGVGGFFAQKCVEVDAQAGGGREPQGERDRIDIYDEDEPVSGWDAGLEDFVAPRATPEPAVFEPTRIPALPAPEQPAPVAAQPDERITEPTETITEATARWAQEAEAFVAPPAPEPVPPAPKPAPSEPMQPPVAPAAAEPLSAESFVTRLEQAAAHVDIDELVKLVTSGRVLGDPPVAPAPASAPAVAPEPLSLDGGPAGPAAPEPIIENQIPETPLPPAADHWLAKQAGAPDSEDAAAVTAELTAQGISESWAQQLIVAASAHRSPLAKGSLRDAVRATLAAIIPAPAPLPPSGAAIAFVGAGGAGKTRCAAALATAYAKGSTLAASVVSLGSDDWGGDLKELLKGQNVWVMGAATGAEAAPAVAHGRDGGLVVIDTAAAAPRDPATVDALAAELRSLKLDAVYIVVPATFSVHAARKLIDGFAALGADGIAVTHADEADQLGIAAELSQISGMPVAYIHEGLELEGALSAADPSSLAARLLP
jgi:flagellar biosynthesis GTPase FlhF